MLLFICIGKRQSALKGVSPVQWWILTSMDELGIKKHKLEVGEKVTELFKPTKYFQISSNTPEDTSVDEGQGLSANMPDTISTSSSEVQSVKTSIESKEGRVHPENIGKYIKQATSCSSFDISYDSLVHGKYVQHCQWHY